MDFEYKEEYPFLTNALLNVTDDCNLACRYCFVEQHPHYMSLEVAKQAVDWLYQNLQKKKALRGNPEIDEKIELTFFGGEPLLCYSSVIYPLINYINNTYPDSFNYGITTNGTLLTSEIIDFFEKNNVGILLSFDGIEQCQIYNRPCKNSEMNSYNLVMKNIPLLLKSYPNLTMRSTGYAPTIQHLFDNYKLAEQLGFKNWVTILDMRHPWDEKSKNILKEQINLIYQYRLKQILNNQPILNAGKLNELNNFILNPDIYLNGPNETLERCGLGTTGGSIGWDGNIYGCQEQTSKGTSSIFYIGNIFTGIDVNLHKKLLSRYYNSIISNQNKNNEKKSSCNNCLLYNYCHNPSTICPSASFDIYKDMTQQSDIDCFLRQLLFDNSLLMIYVLSELDKQEHTTYLNTLI